VTLKNTVPDDLSADEIEEALTSLTEADLHRLRKAATHFAARSAYQTWEDLFQEAVVRALDGTRKCRRDVNVVTFLRNVMRSLLSADNELHEHKLRAAVSDEKEKQDQINLIVSSQCSPEEQLALSSESNAIFALFGEDDEITMILMGLQEGLSAKEIQEISGIDKTTYESARKRMRRKIEKHYPNGRL
jgi:RNA polymerase sigma-70 factor (ECF subfamily)